MRTRSFHAKPSVKRTVCPGLDGVPCGKRLHSNHRGYCKAHHAEYNRRWRKARTQELHELRALAGRE